MVITSAPTLYFENFSSPGVDNVIIGDKVSQIRYHYNLVVVRKKENLKIRRKEKHIKENHLKEKFIKEKLSEEQKEEINKILFQ